MALIDKASLLMVPSTYEAGKLYNVLPSGNRAPDSTDQNSGYDQTRADFDFDRGSNAAATRIDSNGVLQKYRENKLLQSNQFDTTWATTNASVTSGQSGYNGSSDAWLFTATNTAANLIQSVSSSGVNTFSIYAKAGTQNGIFLRADGGDNPRLFFKLNTGTIGSEAGTIIDSSIESVGNGWYRVSLVVNVSITQVRLYVADDNNNFPSSGNIYIQSAQLETGLVATDVLTSGATTGKAGVLVDLPRINYDANGENGALLLEPSRTNTWTYSEPTSGAIGGINNVSVFSDIDSFASIGLYGGAILQGGQTQYIYNGPSVSGSTTYALSCYIKTSDGAAPVLANSSTSSSGDFIFVIGGQTKTNLDSGIDYSITQYSGDIYKVVATMTSNTSPTNPSNNGIIKFSGNRNADLEITGLQWELGSYSTSYIPTMGTSETRAADSCLVTGVSDVIGQTEGTLFIEAENNPSAYLFAAPNNVIFGSINSGNYLNNFHFTTDASKIYVYCNSGGTLYASPGTTLPSSSILKMAVTYTSSAIKFFLNGVLVGTDTSFNLPVGMNQIDVGHMGGQPATQKMRGGIDKFIVFTEAITDAEAITLTTL